MTMPDAEAINASIRYVLYAVFATDSPLPHDDGERRALVEDAAARLEASGTVIRGFYDLAGMRADADLLVWLHGETLEQVQDAFHRLVGSPLGAHLRCTWSAVGLHRPAEFNRSHVPAFLAGEAPGRDVCVYPFVRSYEWFLLPPADRSRMLREHGEAAHDYADVRANTVASFGLGDYEFLLAFEAPEMHRIVDLMRELRGVEARRHVREEV
ncbi:MAG TPA: chlorite dismutase family protein, partial [Verrucomicrobiota bacterium]|nr:chlorite dismutase family protein [Verrucomicrobiota bacterium]